MLREKSWKSLLLSRTTPRLPPARRDGRAVECTGLENRRARKGTQGSNPCLSAYLWPSLIVFFAQIPGKSGIFHWLTKLRSWPQTMSLAVHRSHRFGPSLVPQSQFWCHRWCHSRVREVIGASGSQRPWQVFDSVSRVDSKRPVEQTGAPVSV